jgi:hypothetical protein
MDFVNTETQWKTNGVLYPLHARAKRMTLEMYQKTKLRQLNKSTTMPKRDNDIWAIVEILEKGFGDVMRPSRKMNVGILFDALPKLETSLVRQFKNPNDAPGGSNRGFGDDQNAQMESHLRLVLGGDGDADSNIEDGVDEAIVDGNGDNDEADIIVEARDEETQQDAQQNSRVKKNKRTRMMAE